MKTFRYCTTPQTEVSLKCKLRASKSIVNERLSVLYHSSNWGILKMHHNATSGTSKYLSAFNPCKITGRTLKDNIMQRKWHKGRKGVKHRRNKWNKDEQRNVQRKEVATFFLRTASGFCRHKFSPWHLDQRSGQGLPLRRLAITHTHTHSVGLLWTSDQLVEQTSTSQHTTLTTDRHPRALVGFEPAIPASERPQNFVQVYAPYV